MADVRSYVTPYYMNSTKKTKLNKLKGSKLDVPTKLVNISEYTETNTVTPTKRTTGGGGVNSLTGAGFDSETGTYVGRRTTGGGGNNKVAGSYIDSKGRYRTLENDRQEAEKRRAELATNRSIPQQQKRSLSDMSMSLSKSARYKQIGSNLSTLASSNVDTYNKRQGQWQTYNNVISAATPLATAISPWLGAAVGLIGGLGNLFNNSSKYKENAQLYSNMEQSIHDYLTNLTTRDTTIMNTMDEIYSSMDNLRGVYGSEFVDMMYNYYLAKSGMTSDAYSLLTGNFETFEQLGYGKVSNENGIFDTLTDGNQALFNNVYAQLKLEDITGNKNLLDSMVQSLYGANTEMGIQLRQYENELRTALTSNRMQTNQYLFNAGLEFGAQNAGARSENISATEEIGSAEAEVSSSGLRGGTTGNNVALARLSRDLGQIQRTANTASLLGTLKYNVMNAQLNASSTAYSYRTAQKKAIAGALNNNVIAFNSIGRKTASGEYSSNYYLSEAQSNQKRFSEDFEQVAEKDKDKIIQVAG